jgi:hypothetical protein
MLTVRCRLYDTISGALLDSATHKFSTNRGYVALAHGQNDLTKSDLIQMAAKNASEWAAVRVSEAIFPIKVLDQNEKEITINRGSEAGLKIGQVLGVYSAGKELRDPDTGEALGREEVTVGKVLMVDLHEKFSKARILEDKGIKLGAYLRRVAY